MTAVRALTAQALLLDFDGLICDTERAAHLSWENFYGRHGLVFPDEVWAAMTGRASGESYAADDLAGRLGRALTPEELAERRADKARLAGAEPLRPGVARLLDGARRQGIPCAVVSSSDRAWVRGHLERLGVIDRFAQVVTGDQVHARKPAPDLYLRGLELLGTRPEDGLALEDSATGVAAAKAAGLRCVAVPGERGSRRTLGEADLVLASLEHLTPTKHQEVTSV
ncbi:HAD-IA family hydrolase [Streptomyces sp. NBC_01020]|uniref:HAD family hydrolase n=1 Tax=unclassified Streptomyces TaxID=2593676 RepID=UPI003253B304|nr:HAD-IA family hydrolase [Streptomyces sp. NBC_01020]WSX66663.1 HAD-IA family hydrolase [Streptomyces sp. NBC_00932]